MDNLADLTSSFHQMSESHFFFFTPSVSHHTLLQGSNLFNPTVTQFLGQLHDNLASGTSLYLKDPKNAFSFSKKKIKNNSGNSLIGKDSRRTPFQQQLVVRWTFLYHLSPFIIIPIIMAAVEQIAHISLTTEYFSVNTFVFS